MYWRTNFSNSNIAKGTIYQFSIDVVIQEKYIAAQKFGRFDEVLTEIFFSEISIDHSTLSRRNHEIFGTTRSWTQSMFA